MINRYSNQIVCHFINNAQDKFCDPFEIWELPSNPYLTLTMVCNSNKFGAANASLVVYWVWLAGIHDILL